MKVTGSIPENIFFFPYSVLRESGAHSAPLTMSNGGSFSEVSASGT
jgi:hypothetical protein